MWLDGVLKKDFLVSLTNNSFLPPIHKNDLFFLCYHVCGLYNYPIAIFVQAVLKTDPIQKLILEDFAGNLEQNQN